MTIRHLLPFVLLGVVSLAVPARAQEGSGKVATANTLRIFNEMTETKDLQQKLQQDRKRIEADARERQDKLNALKATRDQLKPDSPQYQEANKALLEKAIEYDAWTKITQADLARNQKAQMKQLFDKIEAAVADVAAKKGIDIVVMDQRQEVPGDFLDNPQVTPDQIRAMINSRNVLYSSPKADITNDVLASLNAKYAGSAAPATLPK